MARYLIGRYILPNISLSVMIVVSVITFVLMHSVPGGPFDESKSPLPPAAKANIMAKYGLDKPMYVQYLSYMRGVIFHFDFGIPYQQPNTTVTALIAKTWKVTLQVGIMTVLLSFSVGITLGVLAAYRQNTWIDNTSTTSIAMLGITTPNFVVSMWLILIFAVRMRLLPMGGWNESGVSA